MKTILKNNILLIFLLTIFYTSLLAAQNNDCFDDDAAAVALASMWNPDISGCEDAIPYLQAAGYPCGTDLSVLGMSGTIADICECECENQVIETTTVVDIIVESENHNILENAVIASELDDDLIGEGPFTVFAPTDDAFNALPAGTLEALLEDPTGDLANILLHHVYSGNASYINLMNFSWFTSLLGTQVSVSVMDGNVMIDDAMVIVADLEADNGVVHVIDIVLIPADCVNDDAAAVSLASMWNPDISGCEDAIPYLQASGYPCDTDLSVLGMSGTIEDICECTCDEFQVFIAGCTDMNACNYNPQATEEDGTCGLIDDCGDCQVPYCYDIITNTVEFLAEIDCVSSNLWIGNDCENNNYCLSSPENLYWNSACVSINEHQSISGRLIIKDLLGRELSAPSLNKPILYIYDNGSVEKQLFIN